MRSFLILCLLLSWGCVPRHTGVRIYEMDLRLSVEAMADEQRAGESARFDFVVANVGKLRVEACLDTEDLQYKFLRGGDYVGGERAFVDHPGCLERFVIGPGQEFRWTGTTRVPDRAVGADELAASITVVDPMSCGFGGCLSTRMEARGVPVRVVGGEP